MTVVAKWGKCICLGIDMICKGKGVPKQYSTILLRGKKILKFSLVPRAR